MICGAIRWASHETSGWAASFCRALKQRARLEPELKAHKLRGQLTGLWASWVEYDCRIVFVFAPDSPNEDAIVLVDIGSHDEVY